MPIHIGVLSDPRNFHAQKWSKALREAGAQVSIFSFDPVPENVPDAYQIFPEGNPNKKYDYFSYLNSGNMLADALAEKKVDVLNPLSITPFGVWAMKSGFHPIVASALGADILEYPKTLSLNNPVLQKGWGEQEINDGLIGKLRSWTSNRVFRKYVKQALAAADFVTGDNALLIEKMNEWFEVPPEKMEVLRWGVEEKLFMVDEEKLNTLRLRFNLSKEDRVIFSPRGAKPVYQPDIILRAFTAVLETGLPHLKIIFLSAGYEISSSTRQQALELEKRFPNFMINLLSVGEESGRLDEALSEIANFYERESDESIRIFTSLLEPLMILAMGLVVGFIVIAMLLPMFEINMMVK